MLGVRLINRVWKNNDIRERTRFDDHEDHALTGVQGCCQMSIVGVRRGERTESDFALTGGKGEA
jgi:hypothetical protein